VQGEEVRRRDHERVVIELHREITYLQRQNDALIDKLLYVTGNTWTPPPVVEVPDEEPAGDFDWSPESSLDAA
jgi:hypothetical protein